jgi:hypothetical protein
MTDDARAKGSAWHTWLATGTLLLVVSALIAFGLHWYTTAGQRLGAFADVWNTADAIRMHVDQKHQWPRDWNALAPYLAGAGGDISNGVPERVDVNFHVDLAQSPEPTEWYVHLKTNGLPGEEQAANESLYRQRVSLDPHRPSRK